MYLYRAVSSEDKLAVGGALLRQAVGEVDVGSLCVGALPPQPVGEAEGHCVRRERLHEVCPRAIPGEALVLSKASGTGENAFCIPQHQ